MRQLILATILFLLASFPARGQGPIYLPLLVKGETVAAEPILRVITQDGKIVDLLADWEISDPYWRPQIARYKGDGNYVDSAIADGSRLVSKKYANVIETIPLTARGTDQALAINKIRELLQVIRQAADYWTEPYEYDYAWLEVRPACNDCRTGYARIVKANVPELNNPYGQPFFSAQPEAVMDDLTLIIEREPLWRGVQPGTLIGPLYNVAKNPDFELWNFGVTDSQPDSWNDLESAGITGTNSRDDDNHSGDHSLKVRVSQSTATNLFKGVSQVIASTRANTTYTVVAWVRNDGVSNGVGRILVTYSSQLEIYRSSSQHGWQLYTGTFTTGAADTVAIDLEILTTAANTDGTVYFDSVMLLEGDWEQEAIDGMLPYMTSSHIVNHWDQVGSTLVEAGDLNYVDMWDVPGDESALVKLEMVNNTQSDDINSPVVYEIIRAGLRRAKDVTQFTNFYDPPGVADTTASGDDRVNSGTLSTTWTTVGFFTINDPDIIQHNLGRFRALARVWDTSTSGALDLEVRLRYWIGLSGTSIKTLDSVTVAGRGAWHIVDLTGNTALNWDIKGKVLPGSVGFEVQMKRATGSSQAYLDYTMILPTDGGVLFANVSPSVAYNSGLVVDNTNSSNVYGARLPGSWREVYQTTGTLTQRSLKDFNGALYIAGDDATARLFRFQNNSGTFLHDYGGVGVTVLEVYNNKLYSMHRNSPAAAAGYASDGITIPGPSTFTFDDTEPYSALSFRGKLYIGGIRNDLSSGALYEWDGAAATATARIVDNTYGAFVGLGPYKNKLYIAAQGNGGNGFYIIEFDPTGLTYSQVLATVTNQSHSISALAEFRGKLYVAGSISNILYRFDGSTWESLNPLSLGMSWNGLAVVGDRLFIAGFRIATNQPYVMSTLDGDTWRLEYIPGTTGVDWGMALAVSQGQLFMGTFNAASAATLHATVLTENQYKVADYQLSEFKAPNREGGNAHRHRYFFSYDREDGVNVADDAMLIGVGIVPQYLSLVGAN